MKNLALSQGTQTQFHAGTYVAKKLLNSGCASLLLSFTPGKLTLRKTNGPQSASKRPAPHQEPPRMFQAKHTLTSSACSET